MIIAIPLVGGRLSMHFGHCENFALVEADPGSKKILDTKLLASPPHQPGLLPQWLHEHGAQIVIAGGMGQRAQQLFTQNGIQVVVGAADGDPQSLVTAYLEGTLQKGANFCDH